MISIQGGYPDSFDAAIIANILHIMPEHGKGPSRDIKRVLKPDGWCWALLPWILRF